MAMRVVVTGGAGHLGSAVCEVLAEAGLDVLSVDRVYERDLPVRQEVANLLDGPGVYRLLRDHEAVVHLANIPNPFGPTPPQQVDSDNVTMDMNVFQAAVQSGCAQAHLLQLGASLLGQPIQWTSRKCPVAFLTCRLTATYPRGPETPTR